MEFDTIKGAVPKPNTSSSDRHSVPHQSFVVWGPKGGTGKTTLTFNIISEYARQHPHMKCLAVDMDPQANLSHALFGGGTRGPAQANQLMYQRDSQLKTAKTVSGYLLGELNGIAREGVGLEHYVSHPSDFNSRIPDNVPEYLLSISSCNTEFTLWCRFTW